jgi:hypothetical protein
MWCGGCYTSHPTILFHVKQRESFDDKNSSDQDKERVTRAWGNKQRPADEYLVGQNGDHLMIPFECDFCIFRRLRNQDPLESSQQDQLLLAGIRRVSLEAFWSRASSTAAGNRDKIKQGLNLSRLVGLEGPYVHFGSMPATDTFGYEVAVTK